MATQTLDHPLHPVNTTVFSDMKQEEEKLELKRFAGLIASRTEI
jgi:hypothetical protein